MIKIPYDNYDKQLKGLEASGAFFAAGKDGFLVFESFEARHAYWMSECPKAGKDVYFGK